jgi:GT2 family glycosyltransferase
LVAENIDNISIAPEEISLRLNGSKDFPLVSIVVVSWNKKRETEELIESLVKQKYDQKEIIVVDNASSDGTVKLLRQKYQSIRIIELNKNYGLHKGFNIGVKCSRGEIIVGIDQDCILFDEKAIDKVVEYFKENQKLGLIAFNVKNYYSRRDAWDNPVIKKKGKFDKGYPCFAYNGSGFAFLAEVYKRVGGLTEEFFIYFGEIDITLRVIELQYECRYFENITVFHKSSLKPTYTNWYIRNTTRNWIWFGWKNFPLYEMVTPSFIITLGSFIIKKPAQIFPILFETLGGLPNILKQRKKLSRTTINYYKSFK